VGILGHAEQELWASWDTQGRRFEHHGTCRAGAVGIMGHAGQELWAS